MTILILIARNLPNEMWISAMAMFHFNLFVLICVSVRCVSSALCALRRQIHLCREQIKGRGTRAYQLLATTTIHPHSPLSSLTPPLTVNFTLPFFDNPLFHSSLLCLCLSVQLPTELVGHMQSLLVSAANYYSLITLPLP